MMDVRVKAEDEGRVEVKWSHVRSPIVSRWQDQRVEIIATLLVLKGLLMVGPRNGLLGTLLYW